MRWPLLPLRRLGAVVGGGTPTADPENWGGRIPFVTPPDLRPVVGRVVGATERTLTTIGAQVGSSLVPADSVLLSIRAPIGYVARTDREVAFNQGCRAIVPSNVAAARYLVYALVAAAAELQAAGRGTTFTELSGMQMASLEVPAPPLSEQRAIADYLDRETAQIDTLIAKQEQLIATLRERKVAVISEAVTGGLHDSVAHRDTGVPWLGQIPRHWRLKPLWSLFNRVKDVNHPEEQMLSVFREYGVVIKVDHANINKTAENRNIYQLVHPGWLVANRMKAWQGSVGISRHRGIVSGHYICFAPHHGEDAGFLDWLFRSRPYTAGYAYISRGVRIGQAEIDNDDYRLLPVLLPPIEEQREIANFLVAQSSAIDELVAKAERFIELAKERRSALIAAAVTGQIDVPVA